MRKLVTIPMNTLQDLADWHKEQQARHERLAERHRLQHKNYPKYGDTIVRGDLAKAEFHKRAADVAERAYLAELHVQAALL